LKIPVLFVEVFVFDDLFAGLGQFEFFELFVEAVAVFDDGDAGAANEFDESEGFEYGNEPVGLFALAGGFEYGIVFTDHDGAGAVFTEESFYLYLFGDLVGGHFVEGQFLPDDLFVGIVIGLEDLDLFFQLAAEFAHYFFGFVDDDGEAVDAFDFGRRGVEALDIDLPAGEQDGDAVDEADLVFRVDGDGIFLFFGLMADDLVLF
jgi:hypothetical protein